MALTFVVYGTPQPQGSKTKTRWGGMRDANSEVLQPWRELVAAKAQEAMGTQLYPMFERGVPVKVFAFFTFKRPAGHYGTGRNAGVLKPNAPVWHTGKPDADKCFRALGDSLVAAGVLWDDCQIAAHSVSKFYVAPAERPWPCALSIPGLLVRVKPLDPTGFEEPALVADAATWPSNEE